MLTVGRVTTLVYLNVPYPLTETIALERESVRLSALRNLLCLEILMLLVVGFAYIFAVLEVLVIQQGTDNVHLHALHLIMLKTMLTVNALPDARLTHTA